MTTSLSSAEVLAAGVGGGPLEPQMGPNPGPFPAWGAGFKLLNLSVPRLSHLWDGYDNSPCLGSCLAEGLNVLVRNAKTFLGPAPSTSQAFENVSSRCVCVRPWQPSRITRGALKNAQSHAGPTTSRSRALVLVPRNSQVVPRHSQTGRHPVRGFRT